MKDLVTAQTPDIIFHFVQTLCLCTYAVQINWSYQLISLTIQTLLQSSLTLHLRRLWHARPILYAWLYLRFFFDGRVWSVCCCALVHFVFNFSVVGVLEEKNNNNDTACHYYFHLLAHLRSFISCSLRAFRLLLALLRWNFAFTSQAVPKGWTSLWPVLQSLARFVRLLFKG